MAFKTDCPCYASRGSLAKDGFTKLPSDKALRWCGDKGIWIYKCDEDCPTYEAFQSMERLAKEGAPLPL